MYGRWSAGISSTSRDPPAARDEGDGDRARERRRRRRSDPGAGDQVREPERGQDEVRLQELRVEREADEIAPQTSQRSPPALERRWSAHAAATKQEREQRVGVVVAEDQDRGRRERHHDAAISAAAGPNERRTTVKSSEHRCRRRGAPAGSRMLHELSPKSRTDRPISIVASGRLVDGDEVRGVERAEEPGAPALRRRLRGQPRSRCSRSR